MPKVYIVGGNALDSERACKIAGVAADVEVVLVDSMEDVPLGMRTNESLKEIIPFTMYDRYEMPRYDIPKQNHTRPYKYHR